MENISVEDLKLIEQIVEARSRLIEIGTLKGLNHPETIKCSEELDQLLSNFRKIYWESPKHFQRLLEMIYRKAR